MARYAGHRGGRRAPGLHGHRPGARDGQGAGPGRLAAGALDLVEVNEAFAAQSVAVADELKLDPHG